MLSQLPGKFLPFAPARLRESSQNDNRAWDSKRRVW